MQRTPANSERDFTNPGDSSSGDSVAPGKRARTDADADDLGFASYARTDRGNAGESSGDPIERPMASPKGDWPANSLLGAMGLGADQSDGPTEGLRGNPRDRVDKLGAPRTQHRSPQLADATGAPDAATPPDVAPYSAFVKALTSAAAPLHFDAPSSADAKSLYDELPAASSPGGVPDGYAQIAVRIGTAEQPLLEQKAAPDLFIDDQPRAADVDQNGIGDCYLLAALANIAARDAGHLKAMMKPDGAGGATVTLWRRQTREQSLAERITSTGGGNQYVPVQVTVSDELAFNVGRRGGATGGIHGAGLRAAKDPSSVDYWAEVLGPTLRVHRKDVYECARWVPLLEKAYARFCETYDQYGDAGDASTNGVSPASGYEGLVGGFSYHALRVLYGAAADERGDLGITSLTAFPAAGGNILAANPAAVDKLLLLAGKGDHARAGDTTAPILTANTAPSAQVRNLSTALAAALADPDYQQLDAALQLQLAALSAAISVWMATPSDPEGTEGPKAKALETVGNLAVEVARTPNHQDLDELRRQMPKNIHFDEGSEDVREADKKRLRHFGKWMSYESKNSLCAFELTLTGHSSSDGAEVKNLGVSERRAANVKAAIFDGNDAGKLGRHRYVVKGEGEKGAAPGAAWRRVDLAVAADRPDNPLLAAGRSPALRAMMDLVLNVRNLGTDDSSGQSNVYASHAYSVMAVSFLDYAKTELPMQRVPAAQRAGMYGLVDCDASTVKLRNPHHGNEPDRAGMNQPSRAGDGATSGERSDGVFTMSLNEFFRNFNSLDSGVVPRTPNAN